MARRIATGITTSAITPPGQIITIPPYTKATKGQITGPQTYAGKYADDLVTDRAIEWMKQERDKPFCLLLWFTAPHAPFYRARRHLDLYNGVPIPKPDTFDDDLKGYPGKPRAFAKEFQPGRTVDEMVLNLDIGPTLLELAGVPVPANMQGQSMVKLAKGKADNWRKDWLYEYYEYPASQKVRPHRGVRTERYKLIHYYMTPEEFELYDLQSDPGEKQNLYGKPEHAALTQQLKNRIAELRKETGDAAAA
jgi:arylsulfatase A-like enzyme